ncbi:hypothetical protein IDH44_13315 [Paenibacillus sp. IB182496]|uniref:Uncharacterized protein n=1 Tax=Paenibacillus sabuli TaxID=2772509 RepID=A0A927GRZ6_9BACL|nr:hypothetical protein [Paenibacillus sabuli]MBD2846179.1 hypothetical protein [Paenibacillus sabuli]
MPYEKITLDMLTTESVSVKTQQYIDVSGTEYPIGEPHRKAYTNSLSGREQVTDELPATQQSAIFAIWGSTPTVEESEQEA